MPARPGYPLAAVAHQGELLLALSLLAVNPALGGVLARGDRGAAKSTAARGLAELLPTLPSGAAAPFVNLPLGAGEERVVGTLDLQAALAGQVRLLPGLVAEAHGGLLYIDEVNLLPDHLVDALLDVAAMGVNRVQRDGLSAEHGAVFALVGTMNPEEGELRPQFLDRFGLCVDVRTPDTAAGRAEVVRRRFAYDADPLSFAAQWAGESRALAEQIAAARERLPRVTFPNVLLEDVSELCQQAGVRSLRADLTLHRAARTLAALEGREAADLGDVRRVAPLVLMHRQTRVNGQPPPPLDELLDRLPPPPEPEEPKPEPPEPEQTESPQAAPPDDTSPEEADSPDAGQQPPPAGQESVIAPAAVAAPVPLLSAPTQPGSGRLRPPETQPGTRGAAVRTLPSEQPRPLAIGATVRAALERGAPQGGRLQLQPADLRTEQRTEPQGQRTLFIADASGSMGARERMAAVKRLMLDALGEGGGRRDEAALIVFRGIGAELALPFTRDRAAAEAAVSRAPTGGRTPLAHALALAGELLARERRPARVLLLTDGRANVPLSVGGDPWAEALAAAQGLRGHAVQVIDTESGTVRLGRARALAEALRAEYGVLGG